MIQMESLVQVADNTGARSAKMIGVIGKRTRQAHIGDIITCHIRESIPTASVKKGTVVKAVVVRTAARKSYMTHWKMILPLKKRFKIHNETDYEKIIV